jgi:hypothetical protein
MVCKYLTYQYQEPYFLVLCPFLSTRAYFTHNLSLLHTVQSIPSQNMIFSLGCTLSILVGPSIREDILMLTGSLQECSCMKTSASGGQIQVSLCKFWEKPAHYNPHCVQNVRILVKEGICFLSSHKRVVWPAVSYERNWPLS